MFFTPILREYVVGDATQASPELDFRPEAQVFGELQVELPDH